MFREALHAFKRLPHACSKPSFAFVEARNRNNGPRHARSGLPIASNRSPIANSATPTAFRVSHHTCNETLNAVNGSWHACNGSCYACSVIPDAYSATRDALPQTWNAVGVRAYFTSNRSHGHQADQNRGGLPRGKRPLTLKMIRKLHKELGIPAESLIKQPDESRAAWPHTPRSISSSSSRLKIFASFGSSSSMTCSIMRRLRSMMAEIFSSSVPSVTSLKTWTARFWPRR